MFIPFMFTLYVRASNPPSMGVELVGGNDKKHPLRGFSITTTLSLCQNIFFSFGFLFWMDYYYYGPSSSDSLLRQNATPKGAFTLGIRDSSVKSPDTKLVI
jgi:hypothetical protein